MIYGVTTAMGERASQRLTPEERDRHARLKPFPAATSFGDNLPDRMVRGIVFARLDEFPRGPRRHHAAHRASRGRDARRRTHAAGRRRRPGRRGRDSGALSPVRRARRPLRARGEGARLADQRLALRGGAASPTRPSPRAAACSSHSRPSRCPSKRFAHRSSTTTRRWRTCGAMRTRRRCCARCARYLGDAGGRRNLPGAGELPHRAARARSRASRGVRGGTGGDASRSPRSPTIRCTCRPTRRHPFGRCISTGGYHNAMAAPALDDLAGIWADICLLCDRHSARLLNGHVSQLPDHVAGRTRTRAERRTRQRRLCAHGRKRLHRAGQERRAAHVHSGQRWRHGQDDVAAPAFLAWSKEAAGRPLS